jgi:hypothetical protein
MFLIFFIVQAIWSNIGARDSETQAVVSFKKYMPSPLPYFEVKIYPFPGAISNPRAVPGCSRTAPVGLGLSRALFSTTDIFS